MSGVGWGPHSLPGYPRLAFPPLPNAVTTCITDSYACPGQGGLFIFQAQKEHGFKKEMWISQFLSHCSKTWSLQVRSGLLACSMEKRIGNGSPASPSGFSPAPSCAQSRLWSQTVELQVPELLLTSYMAFGKFLNLQAS